MKIILSPLIIAAALGLAGCVSSSQAQPSARLFHNGVVSDRGFVLSGSDRLSTPGTFKPPVEITVVAKTDSTNLRLAYAADDVIFNWEVDRDSLRIVGGPADGRHKAGAGRIPVGRYVSIRWVVTPQHQAIYVDDQLRFEHDGDYSKINRCVSVFPELGSMVTVKSLKVKQMSTSPAGPPIRDQVRAPSPVTQPPQPQDLTKQDAALPHRVSAHSALAFSLSGNHLEESEPRITPLTVTTHAQIHQRKVCFWRDDPVSSRK